MHEQKFHWSNGEEHGMKVTVGERNGGRGHSVEKISEEKVEKDGLLLLIKPLGMLSISPTWPFLV